MKQLRMGPGYAVSAYSQSRVGFRGVPEERECLVGAGIEGAHNDPASREPRERFPIGSDLLRNRRRVRPVEKAQLGAVEPHSLGATVVRQSSVAARSDIGQQRDAMAVGGATRPREPLTRWRLYGSTRGLLINARFNDQLARAAIQKHQCAVGDCGQTVRPGDGWNAQ